MAKRSGKTDAEQKNKQGFDSSIADAEFSKELGSAAANRAHKNNAKEERASEVKNDQWLRKN